MKYTKMSSGIQGIKQSGEVDEFLNILREIFNIFVNKKGKYD